jgi:hypothetical protein
MATLLHKDKVEQVVEVLPFNLVEEDLVPKMIVEQEVAMAEEEP